MEAVDIIGGGGRSSKRRKYSRGGSSNNNSTNESLIINDETNPENVVDNSIINSGGKTRRDDEHRLFFWGDSSDTDSDGDSSDSDDSDDGYINFQQLFGDVSSPIKQRKRKRHQQDDRNDDATNALGSVGSVDLEDGKEGKDNDGEKNVASAAAIVNSISPANKEGGMDVLPEPPSSTNGDKVNVQGIEGKDAADSTAGGALNDVDVGGDGDLKDDDKMDISTEVGSDIITPPTEKCVEDMEVEYDGGSGNKEEESTSSQLSLWNWNGSLPQTKRRNNYFDIDSILNEESPEAVEDIQERLANHLINNLRPAIPVAQSGIALSSTVVRNAQYPHRPRSLNLDASIHQMTWPNYDQVDAQIYIPPCLLYTDTQLDTDGADPSDGLYHEEVYAGPDGLPFTFRVDCIKSFQQDDTNSKINDQNLKWGLVVRSSISPFISSGDYLVQIDGIYLDQLVSSTVLGRECCRVSHMIEDVLSKIELPTRLMFCKRRESNDIVTYTRSAQLATTNRVLNAVHIMLENDGLSIESETLLDLYRGCNVALGDNVDVDGIAEYLYQKIVEDGMTLELDTPGVIDQDQEIAANLQALIDSSNSPFSEGKILEDGRCCDRSMLEELKRVKPNALVGGLPIPNIDFRTDPSQEALDYMYHCRITSAQAWTGHALKYDIHEGQDAYLSASELMDWQDAMNDVAFKTPGQLSEEFWGNEHLIRGFAVENKVNIYIYKTGRNVNDYIPLFADESFTESILLTNHVDNGLHFDLTWHYSSIWTNFDKLLWPLNTCITKDISPDIITSMREIVDMPVQSTSHDMITGAHFTLPPHIMHTDESLTRLVGMFIEGWSSDVTQVGFNVNRIPRSVLERWDQQSSDHPDLDPDGNGALYLRVAADTWANHSTQCEAFLDSDIDTEVYKLLPSFIKQYLVNQNARDIQPSHASSIVYGGETSSGSFSVRQAQEDALVPDGARLNWECGQQLHVLFRLLLGCNGGGKREAWILESFMLGIMEGATRRTLNDETYRMLDNCLNQIRGGMPPFLELRFGGGIQLVVQWFTEFPLDEKDKFIFSAEVNAPQYVLSWFNFHSVQFLELFGFAVTVATVNQAHKFLSTRANNKLIENVKEQHNCSTAVAKAIVADQANSARYPHIKDRKSYSSERNSLDSKDNDTLQQKILVWNRAIFRQKHGDIDPKDLSTEELKELLEEVNFTISSATLDHTKIKCKRCNNTFDIKNDDTYKLRRLDTHWNNNACITIGNQLAAQRDNDDDEASNEGDTVLRCSNCNASADELNIQADHRSQNTLLTIHQRWCPTTQQWGTFMTQVRSKGRPTVYGQLPFPATSDRSLYDAISRKTGLKKMNKDYKPVVGERRADLESAGYTQEMGFFPDRD